MSLEYKPSLGFVETAGLVIAIQVADAMAKAAEVEIISAHKVDGLRVCVICKGDVAACQAAVETGALLAQSLNGLNGYNIIPSPAEEPDSLMDMLEDIKRKKAARKAAMQEALKGCTKTPFEMMELATETLELTASLLGKTNDSAASDLGVSALSLRAAIQGAWLNVLINIGSLKNKELAEDYRKKGEAMLAKALPLADQIYQNVLEQM